MGSSHDRRIVRRETERRRRSHTRELFLLGLTGIAEFLSVRLDHDWLAWVAGALLFWAFWSFSREESHFWKLRTVIVRVVVGVVIAAIIFLLRMPKGATHLDILHEIRSIPDETAQGIEKTGTAGCPAGSTHPPQPKAFGNGGLPGLSLQLHLRLNPILSDQRKYLFDCGRVRGSRLSVYVSPRIS